MVPLTVPLMNKFPESSPIVALPVNVTAAIVLLPLRFSSGAGPADARSIQGDRPARQLYVPLKTEGTRRTSPWSQRWNCRGPRAVGNEVPAAVNSDRTIEGRVVMARSNVPAPFMTSPEVAEFPLTAAVHGRFLRPRRVDVTGGHVSGKCQRCIRHRRRIVAFPERAIDPAKLFVPPMLSIAPLPEGPFPGDHDRLGRRVIHVREGQRSPGGNRDSA